MYDLTSRPRTLGHMVVAVTLCVPVSLSRDKHYVFPHQVPSPKSRRSGAIPYQAGISHTGNDGSPKVLHPTPFSQISRGCTDKADFGDSGPELESVALPPLTSPMT